jgi:hypothetical protein
MAPRSKKSLLDLAPLADVMARQIATATTEEDRIAAGLDLALFCDKECRQSYAADLRTGAVAGLTDDTEFCEYCGTRLPESPEVA